MNLSFSDEQRLLADTAHAFAHRHRGRADVWSAMVDLGWGELPTLTDVVIVSEALGWGAVASPLIPSTAAATVTATDGSIGTIAVLEPGMTDEWDRPAMRGGSTLTGTKLLVPWAAVARVAVVVTADGLFVAEGGFTAERHHGTDTEPVFAVHFDETPAAPLRDVSLDHLIDWVTVARLADAVGAASRALEMSVEYASERHQFGRPIGSFQAVAHRCVDMRTELDACRILMYQAAWALDTGRPAGFEVAAAKAYANEALRRIFGHAHQVHGAIGFSTEHELHLFTRRAKTFELSLGSTDHHLEQVATSMGL